MIDSNGYFVESSTTPVDAELVPETGTIGPQATTFTEPVPVVESRIARGVLVNNGVVENIMLVSVDSSNAVVGFEVPYGLELVIVEDDSPINFEWTRANGAFVKPVEIERVFTEPIQ